MKNWPKPKSMRDIQVLFGFANFYWCFIQSFNKIAGLLTLMIKKSFATRLLKNLLLLIDVAEVDEVDVGSGCDCENKIVGRSSSKNSNRAISYLTSDTRQAFTQLRQAFTKAPIFQYFDLEYHIWIESDMPDYAIGGVLSYLILDNLGRWHLVAYSLQKMILAKTQYKTHNGKLLVIVEAFKT